MLCMRCPRWSRCNAPICPLDPELESRIYEEGDQLCLITPGNLLKILGSNLKETYERYTEVCLARDIKFTPWREVEKSLCF